MGPADEETVLAGGSRIAKTRDGRARLTPSCDARYPLVLTAAVKFIASLTSPTVVVVARAADNA